MSSSETTQVQLNEKEKKLFSAIDTNDPLLLKTALADCPNVNFVDETLMTPLQHAAYKGNKEMVQMLLDQGADPNLCKHNNNYTALHFAALNGNDEVCLALLSAGAKPNVVNSVNRTAAQMAAFVSHYNCAARINNFIPKSEIEYYTTAHGQRTEPYLQPFLMESFLKLAMEINVHPVKIAVNIQNFVGLSEHLSNVKKVLEMMCEREIKKGRENNEVMSFKFHYLAYIVGELIKIRQRHPSGGTEDNPKNVDVTELFTRKILKPNKSGNLEFLDGVLKECIREFPYRESALFRQMVTTLASQESPSALSLIISAISGQRGFIDNLPVCSTCNEESPAKKCAKCKAVRYCDRNCQRLHWHWHKKVCGKLAQTTQDNETSSSSSTATKPINVDAAELSNELQNLIVQN